jgi:hypothetical protein
MLEVQHFGDAMVSRFLAAVVLIIYVGTAYTAVAQSITNAKYPYDNKTLLTFDAREVCKSPTQSPNCLAKLAVICTRAGAIGAECALIGFPMKDRESEVRPLGPQSWKKKWSEVRYTERTNICAMGPMLVRPVGPERFEANPPLPPERIGTHEIIIFAGLCDPLNQIFGYSIFMKETEKGWQATSYKISLLQNEQTDMPPEMAKYNYRADPGVEEECEGYGCRAIFKKDFQPQLSVSECEGRLCAYVARGIRAPEVPIQENYVPFVAPPVFMPGVELQCAYLEFGTKFCYHYDRW